MKIGIIGGGFTGLAAGVEMIDAGHEVVVMEADDKLGGLASGFMAKGWRWSLEIFYHHIFFNDEQIKKMAKRVGWPAEFYTPKTSTYLNGRMAELDTPLALLFYPQLTLGAKIRMVAGLAGLKMLPKNLGMKLEKDKCIEALPKWVGKEGYKKVWEPLLLAKFDEYLDEVNMAWFWARVKKRTKKLGYFRGGFEKLAEKMGEYITKNGGEVRLNKKIKKLEKTKAGIMVDGERFDRVIMSMPAPLVNKLCGEKVVEWPKIDYLTAQVMVLEMEKSVLPMYWLNILEREWPFLVVVEHTRLIDKRNYGGKHILYIGNYLRRGDKRLKMDKKQLLNLFWPKLQEIKPTIRKGWVKRAWKFEADYAQPVFPVNYSKMVPEMKTKWENVWVANMSMVYPWDRGTNYAVEAGVEVAKKIMN